MTLLEKLHTSTLEELIPTSDGAFTIKDSQNRFVHSSRSPLKESKKLIATLPQTDISKTLIIAWGTGLGYHIEELIQLGYTIIAIETRSEVASLFKKNFPIEQLYSFISSPEETQLFDILVQLDGRGFQHFIDLSMLGFTLPKQLWHLRQQGVKTLQSSHRIKLALITSWYLNIIENLSLLSFSNISYTHTHIFQDQELVICSAGPSLRESLPYLQKNRKQLTLMAVDTALLSLLQFNIIPDYVHAVDAKIHNMGDFYGIDHSIFAQMTLIADITLSSQVVQLPWKNVLFVSTAQPIQKNNSIHFIRTELQQYLWDQGIRFPETQSGGSVATSAFHLGIIFGASKVLLVGQDLAYSQNRGHCIGSSYDIDYRLFTHRLRSLETIHLHKVPFEQPTPDIYGQETYSDELLNKFRNWFETSLQDNPELYNIAINASENGACFQHWIHIPLSKYQFLKTVSPKQITLESVDKSKLIACFNKLKQIDIKEIYSHSIYKEYFYPELNDNSINQDKINQKYLLFIKKLEQSLCTLQSL